MKSSRTPAFTHGPWQVDYDLRDGARLTRLAYHGHGLLTAAPAAFRPPDKDYGRYETRPVYGYDDCFPTVDACPAPWDAAIALPDHGELCWSNAWTVQKSTACGEGRVSGVEGMGPGGGRTAATPRNGEPEVTGRLTFSVTAALWPARFTRQLVLCDTAIEWHYEVTNDADRPLPFIHVAHALLPRQQVTGIELPPFTELFDEMDGRSLDPTDARRVGERLLAVPRGAATMLLLRKVALGRVVVEFAPGLRLEIGFDPALFPTLGIWWNNGGYPDEPGCRRTECAFEPIAGAFSSLSKSVQAGPVMTVAPESSVKWSITWRLTCR